MDSRAVDVASAGQSAHPFHAMDVAEVLASLETSDEGLTEIEAAARLARFGRNEFAAVPSSGPLRLLLDQFKNVLILILLAGAGLSAATGHGLEAVIIAVIVVMAAVLGFVQEYRAERAIEALRQLAAPTAKVMRDGHRRVVPAALLVPGDVVYLEAGDRVPADVRLIEVAALTVDESSLTGESTPVVKDVEAVPVGAAIGDRSDLAFAGTVVVHGRGRGVVIATGMHSEFGKVAGMLQTVEVGRTPLQEDLDRVGRVLAIVALAVVAVIVTLGVARGQDLIEMVLFGIALAVAVVPEALPAVVTVSLAIGVRRMVKRNSLVRRLPAVEALGSVSVICTDKTGTLTKNEMTVTEVMAPQATATLTGTGFQPDGEIVVSGDADAVRRLLEAGVLASDANLEHDRSWVAVGDPTEVALVVAAMKAGLDPGDLRSDRPRIGEIPFTSERKRMTTVHQVDGEAVAYSKGAPEVVIAACARFGFDGPALDEDRRRQLLARAESMAAAGLRVLAVAAKAPVNAGDPRSAERDMAFLGLIGMIDPPRPEVPDAVAACHRAGIEVVMITGDHPATAAAIARELGILAGGDALVTGSELATIGDDELRTRVADIAVYARVSPADKLRIVAAWQHHGRVVAMTGDGVNDAPSLKKADVGVAMGITGTDVSKEAAEIILLDDNFASIVAAVEEGRGIFANIKKYLMYLLSANLGEVGLMAGAAFAGLPLPLTAVQILYVNLATDGLPALALSVDPHESDLMERPPRDPRRGIFTKPVVALMVVGGLWSMMANLAVFIISREVTGSVEQAMAHTFVTLVLIEFAKAYVYRSDHRSAFDRPFANRWLNAAVGWESLLLVALVYVPFLHRAFGTYAFPGGVWIVLLGVAATIIPVLELTKAFIRRGVFGPVE